MANTILCVFVVLECAIGMAVTLWFTLDKIVVPAIVFIAEFTSSYKEFKEWRKHNGRHE